MSDTAQALCLCGHGYEKHRYAATVPGVEASGGNFGTCLVGPCGCQGFYVWDLSQPRLERNEFARAALTGLLRNRDWRGAAEEERAYLAPTAFEIADSMLAEAKRRDAEPKA